MGRTLRTLSAIVGAALVGAIGCTIQDTKAPALMGPSGLSVSLSLTADRPILEHGGSTTVRIKVVDHQNQPMVVALRAELLRNGQLFDHGRLSSRDVTTASDGTATLTYFAPQASGLPVDSGQDVVTILVTPLIGGDNHGLLARQLEIRLVPLGMIALPMQALFTFSPTTAIVGQTVTFDASASTRGGVPCLDECGYTWTFGDGTSTMGRIVNKTYSAPGTYEIFLRVSDGNRLAVDSTPRTIVISAAPPPTASFTFVPSSPTAGTTVFFNASGSTAGAGAQIVSYQWLFHDNETGSGVSVQKNYPAAGSFAVQLTVTNDRGGTATSLQQVTVQ
jgi:PKD repeat protein